MFDAGTLQAHTRSLYNYALQRVRDPMLAEDLVQETLLAALGASGGRFAGRSSVRTWLTGILKHKIMDAFRERAKAPLSCGDASDAEALDLRVYDGGDAEPEAATVRQRLLQVCQLHLERLSARAAEVFVLTDVLGHDTDEVCAMLGISRANLWTTRHRVRQSLRRACEAA